MPAACCWLLAACCLLLAAAKAAAQAADGCNNGCCCCCCTAAAAAAAMHAALQEVRGLGHCRFGGWQCDCGKDCQESFSQLELKPCLEKRYREYTHWTLGDLAFELAAQGKQLKETPTATKKFNLAKEVMLGSTGKPCCLSMVAKAHDIKETMWNIACAAVRKGADCYPRAMDVPHKEANVLKQCMAWWEEYVKVHGCNMPEQGIIMINNLPWQDVYDLYYTVDCNDNDIVAASKSSWEKARCLLLLAAAAAAAACCCCCCCCCCLL